MRNVLDIVLHLQQNYAINRTAMAHLSRRSSLPLTVLLFIHFSPVFVHLPVLDPLSALSLELEISLSLSFG